MLQVIHCRLDHGSAVAANGGVVNDLSLGAICILVRLGPTPVFNEDSSIFKAKYSKVCLVSSPLDDLRIDVWMTERQGTAMYLHSV